MSCFFSNAVECWDDSTTAENSAPVVDFKTRSISKISILNLPASETIVTSPTVAISLSTIQIALSGSTDHPLQLTINTHRLAKQSNIEQRGLDILKWPYKWARCFTTTAPAASIPAHLWCNMRMTMLYALISCWKVFLGIKRRLP